MIRRNFFIDLLRFYYLRSNFVYFFFWLNAILFCLPLLCRAQDLTNGANFGFEPSNPLSINPQETFSTGLAFSSDGFKLFVVGSNGDDVDQYSLTTPFDVSTAFFDEISFALSNWETSPLGIAFSTDGLKMFIVGNNQDNVNQFSLTTSFDISTANFDSIPGNPFPIRDQEDFASGIAFSQDGLKMFIIGSDDDEVNQYNLSSGFDITSAMFSGVNFSISSEETTPTDVAFSTNGTQMYIVGNNRDSVIQYSLATPFDLSTASFDGGVLPIADQEISPGGIAFSPDGTSMFLVGNNSDNVNQYDLSIPFDITSSVFQFKAGNPFTISAQETSPTGMTFTSDGLSLFVIGSEGDDINQYILNEAFNISTASFTGITFSVADQEIFPQGITFSSDGLKMFIIGSLRDEINQYSLTSAFDLSTAIFDNIAFSVFSEDNSPRGLAFTPDGLRMFVIGSSQDRIRQYSLGGAYDISTASFDDISFFVGDQETTPEEIVFSNDGLRMFIVGSDSANISQFNLSIPYALSTAEFNSVVFSTSDQQVSASGLAFNEDGTQLFVIGFDGDEINQYSIPPNNPPIFISGITALVEENSLGIVTDVDAINGDGGAPDFAISYSLTGEDAEFFTIDSFGQIEFNDPPDFETPLDSDGDNVYNFTVIADDGASDNNTAELGLLLTVTNLDEISPEVEILNAPQFVNNTDPFTITLAFNEEVNLLEINDISLSNSTASNLIIISSSEYTVDITPDGVGDITIFLEEGVVLDTVGNPNLPSPLITTVFNFPPEVVNPIEDQTLFSGFETFEIDLSGVFRDPNNDSLTFSAETLNNSIVITEIENSTLILSEVSLGQIQIIITANDGRELNANTSFELVIAEVLSTIQDNFNEELRVFPNPISDEFTLRLSTENRQTIKVNLSDISGKRVETLLQEFTNEIDRNFSIKDLKSGIYILSIEKNGEVFTRRIYKE
ncbi:MAG: T9SS type A sorting domain-containing protein [Bacteroidota bacterium]